VAHPQTLWGGSAEPPHHASSRVNGIADCGIVDVPEGGQHDRCVAGPRALSVLREGHVADDLLAAAVRQSGGGGKAFEHDDRKDPVGVLLVLVTLLGDPSVEPVALFSRRHDGLGLEGPVAEFHRHRRVGPQVVKPRRGIGTLPCCAIICASGQQEQGAEFVRSAPGVS
jgi:hypothetical protein